MIKHMKRPDNAIFSLCGELMEFPKSRKTKISSYCDECERVAKQEGIS